MGLLERLRAKNAVHRLSDEAVYTLVAQEIAAGHRRDGLWAKALSETGMNEAQAKARYITLRAQSLRDELTLEEARAAHLATKSKSVVPRSEPVAILPASPEHQQVSPQQWREEKRRAWKEWLLCVLLVGVGWLIHNLLPAGEHWFGPLLSMATAAMPFWLLGLLIDAFRSTPPRA